MKAIFLAALIVCIFASTNSAEARKRYVVLAPECGISMPCEGGAYSAKAKHFIGIPFGVPLQHYTPQRYNKQAVPIATYSVIGKPSRYIAGRLVCARNVNAALEERGIKGTGSAMAKSFDRWGRSSGPQVGAVAVTDRRGGGHVAIVSRVEGNRVWVWNATGGRHGWHEREYTNRHARYRVASL